MRTCRYPPKRPEHDERQRRQRRKRTTWDPRRGEVPSRQRHEAWKVALAPVQPPLWKASALVRDRDALLARRQPPRPGHGTQLVRRRRRRKRTTRDPSRGEVPSRQRHEAWKVALAPAQPPLRKALALVRAREALPARRQPPRPGHGIQLVRGTQSGASLNCARTRTAAQYPGWSTRAT